MNNLEQQNSLNQPWKKKVVDEQFEQNAGVRIHKGKESYGGGSGFYAIKAKPNCPNVMEKSNSGNVK